jgi:thiamine-phosphate pyrophosphorylase
MGELSSWRGLYAIVDPDHCAGRDPLDVGARILEGGCAVMQLRHKNAGDSDLLALAQALRARCADASVPFVINDRADVAALCGADGLHLGQDDLSIADARRLFPSGPIGLSTHDLAQAEQAVREGADLIGFGPVFPTSSKELPDPVVGVEGLRSACAAVHVPVVGIGGVTRERGAALLDAGAALGAAISAICGAEDPREAARRLHSALGGDTR